RLGEVHGDVGTVPGLDGREEAAAVLEAADVDFAATLLGGVARGAGDENIRDRLGARHGDPDRRLGYPAVAGAEDLGGAVAVEVEHVDGVEDGGVGAGDAFPAPRPRIG